MRLLEFKVFDLFGHFDHVIKLNDEEHITILTAPNGYGKTIVLKIIDAIFNSRFNFLLTLNFASIEVRTDEYLLKIRRYSEDDLICLEFTLPGKDKIFNFKQSDSMEIISGIQLSNIERFFPWLDRVGAREWEDELTGRVLDITDVIQMYGDKLPDSFKGITSTLPDWLETIVGSINIHLIQDQRLILRSGLSKARTRKARIIDTIEKYADELSAEIESKSVGWSEISQKLDSSFPSRLLKKAQSFNTLSIEKLKIKLNDLKETREKLSGHKLIASERYTQFLDLDEIKEEDKKVLTLYVNDAEEKLKVYDDLFQRIDLFTSILNKKRLAFKRVKIDREKGFFFVTDKEVPLKLTQLSSGEQHEVVLLFELIFRAKDNVLVLIDEPEISLHIAWQKEFLTDLKRIIQLQNVSSIISTHSPQIIDNNWHLVVDLEKGVQR